MKKRNIPPITDEEEARIQRLIASDPDAPEATDEQLAQARPFAEVFPELLENMHRRERGRPKLERPKRQVTLRLSADVVDHFKSGGPGWQTRIDEALSTIVRSGKS
jgi:uncharacterized protein (DUF4415 family)